MGRIAPEPHARTPDEAGFTLIELLVVLAILGTLVTVAVPRLSRGDGSSLRASAQRLATDLRLLRDQAIRQGVRTALVPADGGYVLRPSGRSEQLPPGTVLTAEAAAPALLPPDARATGTKAMDARMPIGFFPDGSSTGGRTTLRRGGLAAEIFVRGMDGQVRQRE